MIFRASCKIQSVWRRFYYQNHYLVRIASAIMTQRVFRGYMARIVANRKRCAIIKIQCAARRFLAVQKLIEIWFEMDQQHRLEIAVIKCQVSIACVHPQHFLPFITLT